MRRIALLWCLLLTVSTGFAAEELGFIGFSGEDIKGKVSDPMVGIKDGFPYESFAYSINKTEKAEVGQTKEFKKGGVATLSEMTVTLPRETPAGPFFNASMKDTVFQEVTIGFSPSAKNLGYKIVLLRAKIVAVDLEGTARFSENSLQSMKLTLSYAGMRINYINVMGKTVGSEIKLGAE